MQQIDLLQHHAEAVEDRATVCIVGAGAAGLFLARLLTDLGIETIVIEAAGQRSVRSAENDFTPQFADQTYDGAVNGRSFGFGGTTALWGGMLVPHSAHDTRFLTPDSDDVWRHIVQTVASESSNVLTTLGVNWPSDFETFGRDNFDGYATLDSLNIDILAPMMLPFGARHFGDLVRNGQSHRNGRVYLNAVASGWSADNGRLTAVAAIAHGGRRLRVKADQFIIASGTIEAARLLLEMRCDCPEANISQSAAIGNYFSDHVSAPVAIAQDGEATRVAALLAPKFSGSVLRIFYMVDRTVRKRRGFLRIVFDREDTGFNVLRRTFQAVQARRWPDVRPLEYVRAVPGLTAIVASRYMRERLYVPARTPARLFLDVEQVPLRTNAVSLSNERDALGRRRAKLRWSISDDDKRVMQEIADSFLTRWHRRPELPRFTPFAIGSDNARPYDVYHPVGPCRMGPDAESVVDFDLKVRGTKNLWVLGTAVFPSAGSANPTFSMLCLGRRLAQSLYGSLSARH